MSSADDVEQENQCTQYVPHAWKQGVCNICFRTEEEHDPSLAPPEPEPVVEVKEEKKKTKSKKKSTKSKKEKEKEVKQTVPKRNFEINRELIPEKKNPWGEVSLKSKKKPVSTQQPIRKKEEPKPEIVDQKETEEPEEEEEEEEECTVFEPSAWKKNVCRNCFKPEEEHEGPSDESEEEEEIPPAQTQRGRFGYGARGTASTRNDANTNGSRKNERQPLWKLRR